MLTQQMIRAARLDPSLYADVDRDTTTITQALALVLVVAFAAAAGLFLQPILAGAQGFPFRLFSGTMVQTVAFWLVWSFASYGVSARLLGGPARLDNLLRVLAFALAPVLILVLLFLPIVGIVLRVAVAIWVVACGFVGIRQSLNLDTNRAAIVTAAGFLAALVVAALLGRLDIGGLIRV